jgi:hypothetical protein
MRQIILTIHWYYVGDLDGRAVYGVGLRSGIAGSNTDEGMDIRLLCSLCFVGRGHCDVVITRSAESYRVRVLVCLHDLGTSKMRCLCPIWSVAQERKNSTLSTVRHRLNINIIFWILSYIPVSQQNDWNKTSPGRFSHPTEIRRMRPTIYVSLMPGRFQKLW